MDLETWAKQVAQSVPAFRDTLSKRMVGLAAEAERQAKLLATHKLRVRTGRLRNSIAGSVRQVDGMPAIVLSAGGTSGSRSVGYARAQELGATISPRRGRYLAIPLPPALTGAGVLRSRFNLPGGLRSVGSLFAIKGRSGRLLLVERKGDGVVPMFVLHPGPIRITPKRYLRDALRIVQDDMPEAFRGVVEIVVAP